MRDSDVLAFIGLLTSSVALLCWAVYHWVALAAQHLAH